MRRTREMVQRPVLLLAGGCSRALAPSIDLSRERRVGPRLRVSGRLGAIRRALGAIRMGQRLQAPTPKPFVRGNGRRSIRFPGLAQATAFVEDNLPFSVALATPDRIKGRCALALAIEHGATAQS
jgi:hypothetical protein